MRKKKRKKGKFKEINTFGGTFTSDMIDNDITHFDTIWGRKS